jgi:hypothetical protein
MLQAIQTAKAQQAARAAAAGTTKRAVRVLPAKAITAVRAQPMAAAQAAVRVQ